MLNYSEKIEIAQVALASTSEAVNWLTNQRVERKPEGFSDVPKQRHVIEFILHRRNIEEIDFCLARFGTYAPVLKKLYAKSTKAGQLAVLSNTFVGPRELMGPETALEEGDIANLIKRFPTTIDHLSAYFENPNISRKTVEAVVSRSGAFSDIDDESLQCVLLALSKNRIIKEERDDTYLDPFADLSYEGLFDVLWGLIDTVLPPTQPWAYALTPLIKRLRLPYLETERVISTISRWRIDTIEEKVEPPQKPDSEDEEDGVLDLGNAGKEYDEKKSSESSMDDDNEEIDIQRTHSFWFRHALAIRFCEKLHFADQDFLQSFANSEDKAVRLAFFTSCSPRDLFGEYIWEYDFAYPSFKTGDDDDADEDDVSFTKDQQKVVNLCKQYFETDKNEFVESLIYNDGFWQREKERDLLETLSWDLAEDPGSWMQVPNSMRSKKSYMREKHPEFFDDENDFKTDKEPSTNELIRKLNVDLSRMADQVELINDKQDQPYNLASDHLERVFEIYNEHLKNTFEIYTTRMERDAEYFDFRASEFQEMNTAVQKTVDNFGIEFEEISERQASTAKKLNKVEEKLRRPLKNRLLFAMLVSIAVGVWFWEYFGLVDILLSESQREFLFGVRK